MIYDSPEGTCGFSKKKIAKVNRYIKLCNPFPLTGNPRIINSFPQIRQFVFVPSI